MSLSPKSLVMDLLSTMPARATVPIGALVRAAAILGLGENSLRVAVTRLRAQGLVEAAERGHYRLSHAAMPIDRRVRSWYSREDEVTRWDGSWLGLAPGSAGGDRAAARRRERALRLLGFGELEGALRVRPNNLVGGAAAVRERLAALEPGAAALVFRMDELDADADARARALWDGAALEQGYGAMVEALEESAARLASLSQEEAMAESFLLGGEAVRMIVQDPLLPAPIVDTRRRRALSATMRRYHKLGLRAWQGWAGDAVELEQGPTDTWRQPDARGAVP